MFAVLPFSHNRSEYISRILLPICLFVSVVEPTAFPSVKVLIVGRLGPFVVDSDRDGIILPLFFGLLREVELDGL